VAPSRALIGPLIGLARGCRGWRRFPPHCRSVLAAAWLAWRLVQERRDSRVGRANGLPGCVLGAVGSRFHLRVEGGRKARRREACDRRRSGWVRLCSRIRLAGGRTGENAAHAAVPDCETRPPRRDVLTLFIYAALGGFHRAVPCVLISTGRRQRRASGRGHAAGAILIGLGSRVMGRIANRIGSDADGDRPQLHRAVGLALYSRGCVRCQYWERGIAGHVVVASRMGVCVRNRYDDVMSSVDGRPCRRGVGVQQRGGGAALGGLIATAVLGFVSRTGTRPRRTLESAQVCGLVGMYGGACWGECISSSPRSARQGDRAWMNAVTSEQIPMLLPNSVERLAIRFALSSASPPG